VAVQKESLEKLQVQQALMQKHVTAMARHMVRSPFKRTFSVVVLTGSVLSALSAVSLVRSANIIEISFLWHTCQQNTL
jgi:hypothetical protein